MTKSILKFLCIVAFGALVTAAILGPPCRERQWQYVATYPFVGMAFMDPAYAGLAGVPVYQWQAVCVQR